MVDSFRRYCFSLSLLKILPYSNVRLVVFPLRHKRELYVLVRCSIYYKCSFHEEYPQVELLMRLGPSIINQCWGGSGKTGVGADLVASDTCFVVMAYIWQHKYRWIVTFENTDREDSSLCGRNIAIERVVIKVLCLNCKHLT